MLASCSRALNEARFVRTFASKWGNMARWLAPWLALCLGCTLGAIAQAQEQPDALTQAPTPVTPEPQPVPKAKDWSVVITPYFWLAGVGVDIGDRSLNADVGQLLKLLNAGFMVNTSAQYRDFGLVVDYMFVSLDTSKDLAASSVKIKTNENILDMRASYRVLDTRSVKRDGALGTQLFVDMGARYWNLASTLHLQVPPRDDQDQGIDRKKRGGESWADWIIGARTISDVSSRVALGLTANVGGFNLGHSSRFTWEVTTGVRFRIWRNLQLDVGYRALQAVRNGSDLRGNVRTTKLTMSGVLLGAGLAF